MEELCDPIKEVFTSTLGFSVLTPVQEATVPKLLSHCDVAVEACTGSGKTLAFLLPMFELLCRRKSDVEVDFEGDKSTGKVGVKRRFAGLIVSPTRELATQTHVVASKFSDATGMKVALMTGGGHVVQDVEVLAEGLADVVVGTPGRIDDAMERAGAAVAFRDFEMLVLDEADVLLDMGFEKTVTSILGRLPKQRRTGLFSATQTNEVKALIRAGLRNPAVISVKVNAKGEDGKERHQRTPSTLHNGFIVCEQDEKLQLLCQFVEENKSKKVLVFVSTCAGVSFFEKVLPMLLPEAQIASLHGKMVQKRRTKTYETFVLWNHGVLLTTDVAARGIDIPDVDWIVQFDPPQDPNFFVHRVGRTARAGRSGKALLFLLPKEMAYVNLLETQKVPIQQHSDSELLARSRETHSDVLEKIRKWEMEDRDILEKGTRAFIAHLRAYREHKCRFIFRLQDLDLHRVVKSFVLLRLPNLKEFRETKGLKGFEEVPAHVVSKIKYKDTQRERQREERYKKLLESRNSKEGEEQRKLKEKRKRKLQRQQEAEAQGKTSKKKRRKGIQKQFAEEWEDLSRELRLQKQLQKGKISEAEFDRLTNPWDNKP